tara:strand:+ start:689 stop:1036 length:348 start_codon:yes stop_codon:yes gene_type:complete
MSSQRDHRHLRLADWNNLEGKAYTSGNEPPSGDDMEARVRALETAIPDIRERLARMETKIDSIEKHGATKADVEAVCTRVESMGRTMIQWAVGTSLVIAGVVFAAARLIPPNVTG